jgi:hypothetical protein
MALATKYAAMVFPNRPIGRKYTDAGDFVEIVQHNYDEIDRRKLRRFGELVYPGGGSELLRFVEDAKAGRKLQI